MVRASPRVHPYARRITMTERDHGIQDFLRFLAGCQERLEDFAALVRSEFKIDDVFATFRARSRRGISSLELFTHAVLAEEQQVVWWLELSRMRGSWRILSEVGVPFGERISPVQQEREELFADARARACSRIEGWFAGLHAIRDRLAADLG